MFLTDQHIKKVRQLSYPIYIAWFEKYILAIPYVANLTKEASFMAVALSPDDHYF